jgi:hypothetical protein
LPKQIFIRLRTRPSFFADKENSFSFLWFRRTPLSHAPVGGRKMKRLGGMIVFGLLLAAPALAQDQDEPNAPQAGPVENADPPASADTSPDAQDQGDIIVTEAGPEDARRHCDPQRERCPEQRRPKSRG